MDIKVNNKFILLLLCFTFVVLWSSSTGYGTELPDLANTNSDTIDNSSTGEFDSDTTAPVITAIDPADGSSNVPSTQVVNIFFNENIKAGPAWIDFWHNDQYLIPFTTSINGNVLTITPNNPLTESKYTIGIHTGIVTDLANNPVAFKAFSFNVDTTAPVITAIDPADGSSNVPSTQVVNIIFNENIKAGPAWIDFWHNDQYLIPFTTSINGNVLTITPNNPLTESKYTIGIHTGIVTDLANNPVAFKAFSFTVGTYKIEVIYSGTGGDITKNSLVYNNIPKTTLTYQVLEAAKKGTPMVTFGDGTGPKVMMVAGVHGNELPAVIAAMKLINDLNKKPIKGTIYIVPFAIPSSTMKVTRYWNGVNPNSVANKAGTPTNKIITLARLLKVNALADFHSTRPGGVPGKNSILCTKYPTYESYRMAISISKQTGHKLIAAYRAGADYPGAVEDVCNLAKIPAVTCEVLSAHGTVASGSVTNSYKQMIAFLKYKSLI